MNSKYILLSLKFEIPSAEYPLLYLRALCPEYLRTSIPELHGHLSDYRLTNLLHTMPFKNDKYRNSFFPDSVTLWNELGPELRGADSLPIFKKKC